MMTAHPKPATEQQLCDLLRQKRLRVTEQRMILLRELTRHRQPLSHADLTEALSHTQLNRVTIYRNLITMTEVGLLVRTQLGDQVWRFELPSHRGGHHESHPHFVCVECGDVSCVPESEVTLRGRITKNEVHEVQIRGRCRACRS